MKTLKTILLLVLLSTAIASSINAQGCHSGGGNMGSMNHNASSENTDNKYASYGGTVKQVGKYNIEMVYQPLFAKDPLTFYLMNKKGKPLSNQGIVSKAEITYTDKSTGTITLKAIGENGFAGQMANKTSSFICFLTLQINGENITARFDGGTGGKEHAAAESGYVCSMHPEVQSDKPGNCPKFGMALVKKSETSGMKMKCGMMAGMSDMNKMENNTLSENNATEKDTVIYSCSMHPEVQSNKPGNCSKCGMTLEKKTVQVPNLKTEKKEIAKTYTCSMHPEVKLDKPSNCPKCGMKLIKK
ncbi:MAG: hypothetical protein HY840_12495 [Bacteroidetes bacterium]|nr:hypothetical protein [Bacteroidota bacterium]